MPARATPAQKRKYVELIAEGWTNRAACQKVGLSEDWGRKYRQSWTRGQADEVRRARRQEMADEPLSLDKVCDEAKASLDRSEEGVRLFAARYFGHILLPWQVDAELQLEDWFATPEREYAVMNMPPGAGKSTVLLRFAARSIVRNRMIRGVFGSRNAALADRNTSRLRRALEAVSTPPVDPQLWEAGVAVQAESTLALDFGRFKPTRDDADVWRRSEFAVLTPEGLISDEKEPTWSSYGFDSEYLGNRFNIAFWDDIDTPGSLRNMDIVLRNREEFDDQAESRIDPGGMLVIVQQRLSAFDFSNYCLAKRTAPDDEDPDSDDDIEGEPVYRHIVFQAHDESRCTGDHSPPQKPQPEGCLLDPYRLPWKFLRREKATKSNYEAIYQQTDGDPGSVLVQPLWIHGGTDADGVTYPGCWDADRALWEKPQHLKGPVGSVAITDPSGSKFWGNLWFQIDHATKYRYLVGVRRERMSASDLLDYDVVTHTYSGLMVDWTAAARAQGRPITHWIIEGNACQRWIYRYSFFREWARQNNVLLVEHMTGRNKADPIRGVEQLIPNVYKNGLVRLPALSSKELAPLVTELTTYSTGGATTGGTTDLVMAHWMGESRFDKLAPKKGPPARVWRPSWVRQPVG